MPRTSGQYHQTISSLGISHLLDNFPLSPMMSAHISAHLSNPHLSNTQIGILVTFDLGSLSTNHFSISSVTLLSSLQMSPNFHPHPTCRTVINCNGTRRQSATSIPPGWWSAGSLLQWMRRLKVKEEERGSHRWAGSTVTGDRANGGASETPLGWGGASGGSTDQSMECVADMIPLVSMRERTSLDGNVM